MLLAVDIGNTSMTFGLFSGDKLLHRWSLGSDQRRSAAEYTEMTALCLSRRGVAPTYVTGIAIANVVPSLQGVVVSMCNELFDTRPLLVAPGVKTRMKIRFEPPMELGADRIASAVGAIASYGKDVIIVDFGTATTFDCIVGGEYIGGVVAPGVQSGLEGLSNRAARIPRVEMTRPQSVVGRTVSAALQSGIVIGHGVMVDGMLCRIMEEIGSAPVVLTGHFAEVVASSIKADYVFDEAITMKGLRLIYEYNSNTDA